MSVLLINVHLFYGSEKRADIQRRALETAAVARWAAVRRKSRYSFAREVVALGDFNMPKPDKDGGNVVYDALTSRGLVYPEHSAEVGSSIASDNHYDQVAIFPETSKNCYVDMGVFDYDAVIFRDLWNRGTTKADRNTFTGYLRYYMSDHRPMWFRMRMRRFGVAVPLAAKQAPVGAPRSSRPMRPSSQRRTRRRYVGPNPRTHGRAHRGAN
jgi:hypothetical protein